MLTFNLTESKERESYDDSMLKEAAVYRQLHPHISLIHPGFLRHTYEGELPNLPQMEDLHIIDSTADHLLILWCHGMPDVNLNGALVLSRDRTSGPDDHTLDRFKSQIAAHNIPLEGSCLFDNQECTNI